jgi:hypothetical protein
VLRRGDEAECRCFGRLSDGPVDRRSLVRTVALAAIAAAVAVVGWNDPGASPVGWLGGLSTTEALLAAAIVVLAIVAAGQGAFSWQLLRQQGRLLGRIDELEGALGLVGKVRGDEVDASLLDADDRVVPLADLVAGEGETVVMFTDSGCGACEPLLPLLGQAQRIGRPRIVVVGSGDRDADVAKAAEHGIEGMLFQNAFDASSAVGVRGFPGAVTLGPEGSLLAAPALGAEAVRTVLDARVPELTMVEVAGR